MYPSQPGDPQKVRGAAKRSVPSHEARLSARAARLDDSRFSAFRASQVRLRRLYAFVCGQRRILSPLSSNCDNLCPWMCVRSSLCPCLQLWLWGACMFRRQSARLHTDSDAVLFPASSSVFCPAPPLPPPPPLPVTTSVCCWHFWQPEDKTHTSRCSVTLLLLVVTLTQTQHLYIWPSALLGLPIRREYNSDTQM